MRSDGTLIVDPPSFSSWRKLSGFDGASTAEIFQTMLAGSCPADCMAVTSSSRPGSAIRKPLMPSSAARTMSSIAYLSWRVPRSRPANIWPSAEVAARPMSHSSRGPTNSDTSMPVSAPILAISDSSAAESSIAPLPWETRFTVTPSRSPATTTARSTAGPSTLGISIR